MQTRPEFACYVEVKDFLAIDGECVGYIADIKDETDYMLLVVKDEDGDTTEYPYGPFDTVTIVESFEESGDVPDEWAFFYAEGGPFDTL